jgi:methylenetetrahydrofolate dehydrogenase (NADP+)/methenyltetrahydrofolate cyclohydrolase
VELLDGKSISQAVKQEVRAKVEKIEGSAKPQLTLVQVGDDPASSVYVRSKIRSCEECGIESRYLHLEDDITEVNLLGILKELSEDDSVNGILLQLPIPKHIDEAKAISSIAPLKDVDGFHPENLGLLVAGSPRYVPCTPLGIREMLARHNVETTGKHAVVLGRSIIVGKPMALLLSMKGAGGNATVTICNSRTPELSRHSSAADILISAMGRAMVIRAEMVKEGAVVVDVGMNRIEDKSRKSGYRLVGDVAFDEVSKKASFITPVPGGVGPMTVAMLMVNTLKAFSLQASTPNVFK